MPPILAWIFIDTACQHKPLVSIDALAIAHVCFKSSGVHHLPALHDLRHDGLSTSAVVARQSKGPHFLPTVESGFLQFLVKDQISSLLCQLTDTRLQTYRNNANDKLRRHFMLVLDVFGGLDETALDRDKGVHVVWDFVDFWIVRHNDTWACEL